MDALITCLCPTVNRFEALRDAVACFILQDHSPRRLLILADGDPMALSPGEDQLCGDELEIKLVHHQASYETLGHKRQALLEMATSRIVAHWDDDDWYLPWHLSQCAEVLHVPAMRSMVKPKGAWWVQGRRADLENLQVTGPHHNRFEGALVFDRNTALDLGGYPPKHSGQAAALMDAFQDAGAYCRFEVPKERISYCYRWADGHWHISQSRNAPDANQQFADRNNNPAHGRPVIPAEAMPDLRGWAYDRMAPIWTAVAGKLPLPEDAVINWRSRVDLSRFEREPKIF